MSASNYTPPDLASILRSLAASVQNPQPSQPPHQRLPIIAHPSPQLYNYQFDGANDLDLEPDLEEGEYDPSDALLPVAVSTSNIHATAHRGPIPSSAPIASMGTGSSILPPTVVPTPPPKPVVDPRTITTYPAALRHITQTIAQNEATMGRIRKLIASQHQHERQWWDGRVQLVKQQAEREEGRKRVDDVLRSIGGKVSAPVTGPTPAEGAAELLRYDKKVHRACVDMVNATTAELQAIGIPFFGLRRELVLQEGEDDQGTVEGLKKESGRKKLREDEVLALQKRVVELLEDLCQE
ncbi:hypothetical protein MMC30_008039 [Trapelia coarctata]|nr:hypothetical protein [Trapelia coarctata]